MASDSIYLMSEQGLVEMKNEPYESEDLLQELLGTYPDLLAGGQMNAGEPRRWLLVRRELGISGGEGEASRWSLDHLFIDQDAVPTLVEVKRSSDTRLRREVVGQMLDYAANGVKYWPPDGLKAEFEARCEADDLDPAALLAEHLAGGDEDAFWSTVGENLKTGKLRMVFVADVIPGELQRIIEFLNEQTIRSEVFGVEVRQYVGRGQQTLVPRVVGQTIMAQQTKGASPKKNYRELLDRALPETRRTEQLMRAWAHERRLVVRQSAAALQFLTPEGIGVCQFFPGWDSVEIPVQEARTEENQDAVNAFFQQLRTVSTRRKPAPKYPNLLCVDVVDSWDTTAQKLLGDWLHLITVAARPGRPPFGYG